MKMISIAADIAVAAVIVLVIKAMFEKDNDIKQVEVDIDPEWMYGPNV